MKKIVAWLLVLTLVAAVSIGATLAYLTDADEDVNVMTLGKVKIEQLEYERIDVETEDEKADVREFQDNKPLYPAVTEQGFDYTPGDSFVDWTQIGKDGYTSEIWDPSKLDASNYGSGFNNMFTACGKLTGANGSTISKIGSAAANGCVDTPETPGLLTHIKDKPVAP